MLLTGKRNSVLQHKVQHHQSSGTLNLQESEIIQRIVQHDRDMAQCTQLIQSSLNPSPAPPSPAPIIWTPLVQAPLQAAAATTPLALALAHQTQLPPILFHHPVVSPSLKDPPGHPKKVHPSANGCGSGPGSPGQVRTVLDTPTTVSQPVFTSSLQPLGLQPPHLRQPLHPGVASVFPLGHASVSYACPARTSSQPLRGAATTPPLPVGLLPPGLPGRLGSRFPAPSAPAICPLISGSVGPILNHLQQTQTSMQQWGYSHDRSIRTSGGPDLPHFPLICPSPFSGGCTQPGPLAGAAASLAQHSLAGLQSGLLPQVLPEHSALASLAQYGSADASPCYTPPVHSPSLQSPARGRTVPHTELPSTVDSQIPVPATAPRPAGVPGTPANGPETTGGGVFSQEIKTISGSHSSIHQDRPGATGGPSEGNPGLSGSFFSSVDISKPCNPPPGPAAPFSRTHSGPETQNPSAGVHPPPATFPEAERRDSDLPDDS